MIKVAIISPIKYIKFCEFGDIHMALTPFITGDFTSDKYINFYHTSRKYKILDNGIFEMENAGVGCDFSRILKAAEIIKANEIILSDYLYDSMKTIDTAYKCIDILDKKALLGRYSLHAVPQGESLEDWIRCFDEIMQIKEINVIGISKLSVPKCFGNFQGKSGSIAKSRIKSVKHILKTGKYKIKESCIQKNGGTPKKIHLLGGDNWVAYELNIQKRYPFIRSIDTSMPIWYALNNRLIDPITKKCEFLDKKVNLNVSEKYAHNRYNGKTDQRYVKLEIEKTILSNLLVFYKNAK